VGPDPPGEGALLGDGAFRCDAVFRQNTLTTSSGCADDIQMQQLFSVLGVRLGDGVQHDAQLGRARAHRGRPPALDHLVPRQDQRETTARPPVQQHAQNRPVTRSLQLTYLLTYTHTRLTALFPGLTGWAGTRKVKPIWILLKQKTVSGSGISSAICKSALRSRHITTPAPHHSVFYRPDALPAA